MPWLLRSSQSDPDPRARQCLRGAVAGGLQRRSFRSIVPIDHCRSARIKTGSVQWHRQRHRDRPSPRSAVTAISRNALACGFLATIQRRRSEDIDSLTHTEFQET
ncbi:MAG: hypothetical protein ACK5PZ_22670, partial [Pirellula sp.]